MKKFGIASRGTGKVNNEGEITKFNPISYDFASLYPNTMKIYNKNLPDYIKKYLLRKERLEKLEKLKEINNEK